MILEGGTDPQNVLALADAAARSLSDHRRGLLPEPIMLVEPGVSVPEVESRPGTAFLVRTSGSSSGTGKLVELPWDSIIASASATTEALGGPGRWLATLPVHHVAGLQTVLRSIIAGVAPLPYRLGDDIPDGRTYLSLVPTQLRRVLGNPDWLERAAAVDAILVGGQSTPPILLEQGRAAGLTLVTTYGMTETCGGCVYDGTPIGSTAIALEDGRIIIEGPVVALGYAGGEAFGGRFVTNDAGRITDRLAVLGRVDDAITTGGLTIMPVLLEDLVADLFSLASVGLGVRDDEWGERLVLVTDGKADARKIRRHAKTHLGAEYAPKEVISVADLGLDHLPLTDSGKVDRRALAQILEERP